jgi:uncharacterized protein YjdB
VSYTSSNTAVASVDINKGKVSAKKAGTTVITAAARDQSGAKASYTLTVINKPALKVSTAKQSYKTGETVKMTAVITGTGYKNTKFFVKKSDGSGAVIVYEGTAKTGKTVNDSWNAKGADPGTYEVSAVIYGEGGIQLQTASSTFKVTVPVTGLKLDNTKLSLEKGDTFQLTAAVSPKNANQAVSYQTSSSSVASVDQNGLVTAKKAGTATITATASDGSNKKSTCAITVSAVLVSSMKVTGTASMSVGGKQKLGILVLPANAKDAAPVWKSSNAKVAKVDSQGNVTALAKGKATITATATDGSKKSATFKITVK